MTLLTALILSGCTDNDVEELNVVATVNGETITLEEVEELQQQYEQFGQQLSKEDAIEELIDQKILLQHALQDEYMPNTEEAEDEMEAILQQQGMTLEVYKQQLEQQGISYEEVLQDYKKGLAQQNYLDDALEEKHFPSNETAEEEIETMLEEAEMTWEDLELQLPQMGMTYEEFLYEIKRDLAQKNLIEELKEDAHIEYM